MLHSRTDIWIIYASSNGVTHVFVLDTADAGDNLSLCLKKNQSKNPQKATNHCMSVSIFITIFSNFMPVCFFLTDGFSLSDVDETSHQPPPATISKMSHTID